MNKANHTTISLLSNIIATLLAVIFLKIHAGVAEANSLVDDDIQILRAGYNNLPIYAVKNFLPIELATKWRDVLSANWNNRFFCDNNDDDNNDRQQNNCASSSSSSNKNNPWLYATNNDGTFTGNYFFNAKFRGMEYISARKAVARRMKNAGMFAYSKWEFDPEHDLVAEIRNTVLTDERIISKVKYIFEHYGDDGTTPVDISQDYGLTDLFVTMYSTGDFLSDHNDGVSGTYAFVVSLTEDGANDDDDDERGDGGRKWKDDYGGTLNFRSGDEKSPVCLSLKPSFNTAVLFQTRDAHGGGVTNLFHFVKTISEAADLDGFRRFGFTGWYNGGNDVMSEVHKQELDLMRANAK